MKPILIHSLSTIFALTYAAMVVRRSALEIWSLSKSSIETDLDFNSTILGIFDTAYLLSYALGEYINGALCDRIGESIVISIGLFTAGVGLFLMYILAYFSVSNIGLFTVLWIFQGYSHSAVLPGGVSLMTTYFPAETRGKVMGLWATGASAGNVFGIFIFTVLKDQFSLSWPEILLVCGGIMILNSGIFKYAISSPIESETLLTPRERIGFLKAWLIPGVIQYTIAYSCCKFMNYAWMMWLPYYLSTALKFDHLAVGIIIGLYEIGSIIGAFGGGYISDIIRSRSKTVKIMLCFVTPLTGILWNSGETETIKVGAASFGLGISVAGVCYLINSCVSADLAVGKNQIATISGILDGTGSLVTGCGIFFVGFLQQFSWSYVFGIIVVADVCAVIMLQIIHHRKI